MMSRFSPNWRSHSLGLHKLLTGPKSNARAQGLFPAYVRHTYTIIEIAGKLAGISKRHWRDSSNPNLNKQDIARIRSEMNKAFDELEKQVDLEAEAKAQPDKKLAVKIYNEHGLLAYSALEAMESSAALAEPIKTLALGRAEVADELPYISSHAADLRMALNVISESMFIDERATTNQRAAEVRVHYPQLDERPQVKMKSENEIAEEIRNALKK